MKAMIVGARQYVRLSNIGAVERPSCGWAIVTGKADVSIRENVYLI
jgi:hypothetical protein